MKIENAIRILAGTLMLLSLSLGHFVSAYFYWLGVFVGVNLIQSALTGFCPAEKVFAKMGVGKSKSAPCCG